MKKIVTASLLTFFYLFFSFVATGQKIENVNITPNRVNSPLQQQKPYLFIISIDAFRYDYLDKYAAPFLQKMASAGVRAKSMYPSFPSKTFPNHYTLVTGLLPAHHGLVGNKMLNRITDARYKMSDYEQVHDASWYGGTPIWVLAEQQRMLTANYFWPLTDVKIQGILPSYYFHYTEANTFQKRLDDIVDWMRLPDSTRPHLIMLYFPQVDHAGHRFGPDAPETGAAVTQVDSFLHVMYDAIAATGLPVNFMLMSDHGMKAVDVAHPLQAPEIDGSVGDMVVDGSTVNYYIKDDTKIDSIYTSFLMQNNNGYKIYTKMNIPLKYHYGQVDDWYSRLGDIILLAKTPYFFGKKLSTGEHGFDPYEEPDMRATFLAWGPAIRSGKKINAFKNIEVYPLAAKLLGLQTHAPIDGKGILIKKVLR